jgi:hypothetical protein
MRHGLTRGLSAAGFCLQKLSSWYLLVIVSLLIVVELKRAKLRRAGRLVPGRIGHA